MGWDWESNCPWNYQNKNNFWIENEKGKWEESREKEKLMQIDIIKEDGGT